MVFPLTSRILKPFSHFMYPLIWSMEYSRFRRNGRHMVIFVPSTRTRHLPAQYHKSSERESGTPKMAHPQINVVRSSSKWNSRASMAVKKSVQPAKKRMSTGGYCAVKCSLSHIVFLKSKLNRQAFTSQDRMIGVTIICRIASKKTSLFAPGSQRIQPSDTDMIINVFHGAVNQAEKRIADLTRKGRTP